MGLAQVYAQALEAALDGKANVHRYADALTTLWSDNLSADIPIVIVWDRTPLGASPDDRLLEKHLTPLDWALAWSLKQTHAGQPVPSIVIIDATAGIWKDTWAWSVRYQLLADMPWVTLSAPVVRKEDEPLYMWAFSKTAMDNGGAAEDGVVRKDDNGAWDLYSKSASKGPDRAALEGLNKAWAASLSQSDEHHDINNVIGPDILAREGQRRQGLFGAMVTRLAWSDHNVHPVPDWSEWDIGYFQEPTTFVAYVVDDQLRQGWGSFLYQLLNSRHVTVEDIASISSEEFRRLSVAEDDPDRFELHGCLSPLPLIEFLEKNAIFDRRNYNAQIRPGETAPELLFLDLRLYANGDEAKKHAQRLLAIVDDDKVVPPLAWPNIDPLELQRIRDWSSGDGGDNRSADEALLLLPRLLALALPLTPIILFASTGQPWIKERLKPYQNIFTGFEKPRVLSDRESIEESISALHEALKHAVDIMLLRLRLAHAQSAVDVAERQRPPELERLADHHIEIFADETLTLEKGITSGLAVCAFPASTNAEFLQAKLMKEYNDIGTVWARRQGLQQGQNPALSKGRYLARDEEACSTQVNSLESVIAEGALGMPAASRKLWSVVATRSAPSSTPLAVSVAAFPDGPLDKALRFNLEFVLYALIPYFSKDAPKTFYGTIEIHLPTRVVPCNDKYFAERFCDAFDLGDPMETVNATTGQTTWLIPSTSLTNPYAPARANANPVSSTFPLVRGWLQEYQETTLGNIICRITKIKTTNLSRGTDEGRGIAFSEAQKRRLFHDVADWACTASQNGRVRNELRTQKIFQKWFIPGNDEKFSQLGESAQTLMNALKASRRSERGTDALRIALQSYHVENCSEDLLNKEYCARHRLLLWMLRPNLENARGKDLHSLLISEIETHPKFDRDDLDEPSITDRDGINEYDDDPNITDHGNEDNLIAARPAGSENDRVPEFFDEARRAAEFPAYETYEVVHRTKNGDIFCKHPGNPENVGTHWTRDVDFALQLSGEGWPTPRIVLAIEPGSLADPTLAIYDELWGRSDVKRLRVVAVQLLDGRWKRIRA